MKRDSIVFAIAGTCFGIIVGWVLGSQQAQSPRGGSGVTQQQSASAGTNTGASGGRTPILDETQAKALRHIIETDQKNSEARVRLADLYFDAERYDEAANWYQEALNLNPRDVNASTDLGVAYYYLNQPDRALAQFDSSLKIDPKHAKTILNQGIVKAFGKQDLDGAAAAWQRVVQLAPGTQEADAAKRALDSMKSAHPGTSGVAPPSAPGAN